MPDQPAPVFWKPPPGGLPPSAGRPLHWIGHGDRLFGIHFGNIGLAILTLGIYRFWGIARIRRYVWAHAAFLGDRLEYTGTGGELLRGFLIVLAVLVPLIFAGHGLDIAGLADPAIMGAVYAAKVVVFLYLLAVGRHAARRYLASRTLWRGLRFVVTGSPWRCGAVLFGWWIATLLTLGLARPWALAAEARWSFGRLQLGTLAFRFTGTGRQLLGPWLVAMAISIVGLLIAAAVMFWIWKSGGAMQAVPLGRAKPALSPAEFETARLAFVAGLAILLLPLLAGPFLLFAWYSFGAAELRWRWGNLELGGARFAMPEVGAGRLARLSLGNWFLRLISFGLLYPVTVTRTAHFLAGLLWTDRFPDVGAARQVEAGPLNAEGLANVLDGGGAGIGI